MNRNTLTIALCLFALLVPATPEAAQAEPGSPAPLGFVIGQATYDEVESALKQKTRVKPIGTNPYSRGPMLRADGDLGLDNLQRAVFIFNPDKRLVAVVLTFTKQAMDANFGTLYAHLASKYTLVTKRVPFVGNKTARFSQGDVLIDIESLHMDFVISIMYRTKAFERVFRDHLQQKQQRQSEDTRKQF